MDYKRFQGFYKYDGRNIDSAYYNILIISTSIGELRLIVEKTDGQSISKIVSKKEYTIRTLTDITTNPDSCNLNSWINYMYSIGLNIRFDDEITEYIGQDLSRFKSIDRSPNSSKIVGYILENHFKYNIQSNACIDDLNKKDIVSQGDFIISTIKDYYNNKMLFNPSLELLKLDIDSIQLFSRFNIDSICKLIGEISQVSEYVRYNLFKITVTNILNKLGIESDIMKSDKQIVVKLGRCDIDNVLKEFKKAYIPIKYYTASKDLEMTSMFI